MCGFPQPQSSSSCQSLSVPFEFLWRSELPRSIQCQIISDLHFAYDHQRCGDARFWKQDWSLQSIRLPISGAANHMDQFYGVIAIDFPWQPINIRIDIRTGTSVSSKTKWQMWCKMSCLATSKGERVISSSRTMNSFALRGDVLAPPNGSAQPIQISRRKLQLNFRSAPVDQSAKPCVKFRQSEWLSIRFVTRRRREKRL